MLSININGDSYTTLVDVFNGMLSIINELMYLGEKKIEIH